MTDVMQADVEGGILMMRAPAGRGLVAIGNAAGQLVLADPRTGSPCLPTSVTLDHKKRTAHQSCPVVRVISGRGVEGWGC